MQKIIEEYLRIDAFDPEIDFDYEPLRQAICDEWDSPNSDKALLFSVIDKLADVGEILDQHLAAILSECYSLGIGEVQPNEKLAEIWSLAASSNFGSIYDLTSFDIDNYTEIKKAFQIYQLLDLAGDLRATRLLPPLSNALSTFSLVAYKDIGMNSLNEAIYYATSSITYSKKLQDPDTIKTCSSEVRELWFDQNHIDEYRSFEAEGWYNRGKAYRFKYKENDDSSLRSKYLVSMKNAALLGHENAAYYFPVLLLRSGTDEQINEAGNFAKEAVLTNPEAYIVAGDNVGKETNDEAIGSDAVCMIAQFYAQGLDSFPRDGNLSHQLFTIAAKHNSEWANDSLSHFKKKIFGGWEFID